MCGITFIPLDILVALQIQSPGYGHVWRYIHYCFRANCSGHRRKNPSSSKLMAEKNKKGKQGSSNNQQGSDKPTNGLTDLKIVLVEVVEK